MNGKRLDIWGLPIEDDVESGSETPTTSGDVATDTQISPSSLEIASGEESPLADAPSAGAVAIDETTSSVPVQDMWGDLAAVATPVASESQPMESIVEDAPLAAAPAAAPASETAAPVAADEPALAAAPAKAPAEERLVEPEPAARELHAPDEVFVPVEPAVAPAEATDADVDAMGQAASEASDTPTAEASSAGVSQVERPGDETVADTSENPALESAAAVAVVAGASARAAGLADTSAAGDADGDVDDEREEQQSKPERAWIPPGRKKKGKGATQSEQSSSASSAAGEEAKPAVVGSLVGAQLEAPAPSAGASATPAAGQASETQPYAAYAPPGAAGNPASVAATTDVSSSRPSSSAPSSAGAQSTASAASSADDFWGVPPAAAQPAAPTSSPAAQRPSAASSPASAAPVRSTSISTTAATPSNTNATAAVGGLVPTNYLPPDARPLPVQPVVRTSPRPPLRPQSEGRIEVINPEGWKREFPLRKSILYVGSAVGADILVPGAEVAPRHLQFVPSQANRIGYRLINLGGAPVGVRGATSAEPRVVAPRASTELVDGDRIELAGYAFVFYSGEMSSQLIQVRVEVPNPVIGIDKPMDGALYIRNGGDRAGVQFMVEVQGIDNRFIQIEPGPVLFPDGEKRVAFRIAHPHTPAPAAGDQPINFVVTAPEGYPGETAVASQVVSIAPFFAHKVRLIAIEPELSGFSLSSGR